MLAEKAQSNWPLVRCRLHARFAHSKLHHDNVSFVISREKISGKIVFIRCETCGAVIYHDTDLFNEDTILEETAKNLCENCKHCKVVDRCAGLKHRVCALVDEDGTGNSNVTWDDSCDKFKENASQKGR